MGRPLCRTRVGVHPPARYSPELIHGLLQTRDYACAVTQINPDLSDEVVEQRVRFRMQRQKAVFARPNPGRLSCVMTAGALNLIVGGTCTMQAQFDHLRDVVDGNRIDVRVLADDNGLHTAMRGPFTIMDFDDPDDPAVVYVESLIGSRYLERADHLDAYRRAFGMMEQRAVPLEEYLR